MQNEEALRAELDAKQVEVQKKPIAEKKRIETWKQEVAYDTMTRYSQNTLTSQKVEEASLISVLLTDGMWMCAFGKCASRPVAFPNKKRLDKHKTCHSNEKCVVCGKNFNAKRNMLKHKRNIHDKRSAGDVEQPVGGDPHNEAMLKKSLTC